MSASDLLVLAVAALHLYFAALEMVWWTTPRGRRAFGLTEDFAKSTRAMAANQGLYNVFLAAGLAWGVAHPDRGVGVQFELFFLGCVVLAGIFGAITVSRKIAIAQALPAAVAIAVLLGTGR